VKSREKQDKAYDKHSFDVSAVVNNGANASNK
jgi:hypothetical protein